MGAEGERARLGEALVELVQRAHFVAPDGLPGLVERVAGMLGAERAVIHLVDYEQVVLRPLVPADDEGGETLEVDTTAAGHAFRTLETLEFVADDRRHLWTPLLNGTDRLGVLELWLPPGGVTTSHRAWETFASLIADLIVSKSAYGDAVHIARRRRPMALRAEAQRQLLPPLTAVTPHVAVSGMLEPSYEVAGDTFDYALHGDRMQLAIYDAMGHSLGATLTASVAVAAVRNARREGARIEEAWHAADRAVALEFNGERFVTAVLAELRLSDGRLRLLSAGHPPPLLVRQGVVVDYPDPEPALPLGLGDGLPEVTQTQLQPRDRLLLFTDGIVEARSASGEFFGRERLVDMTERESASGLPLPEVVRRLIRAVMAHQGDQLQDDATLMLVDWLAGAKAAAALATITRPLG